MKSIKLRVPEGVKKTSRSAPLKIQPVLRTDHAVPTNRAASKMGLNIFSSNVLKMYGARSASAEWPQITVQTHTITAVLTPRPAIDVIPRCLPNVSVNLRF